MIYKGGNFNNAIFGDLASLSGILVVGMVKHSCNAKKSEIYPLGEFTQ